MKNGDLRAQCLAALVDLTNGLPRSRRPAALGWKLTRGALSPAEVRAFGVPLDGAAQQVFTRRWQQSSLLRAFLVEYRQARNGGGRPTASPDVRLARNGAIGTRSCDRRSADDSRH